MTMTNIDGYRVVIECRPGAGAGYVLLQLNGGETAEIRSTGETYAELSALVDLLRNEPGLQWDDAERIVQSRLVGAGRRG